ncbi:MAG: glycosyltransferase, partial [Actinomycetota bacterium]|nr:glycosyltransferase [Actinomycetota bacterium]
DFSHSGLLRRARRVHESKLRGAVDAVERAVGGEGDIGEAGASVFDSVIPALPYVPAMAILGAEKRKLSVREGEPRRVAMIVDGIGSMHGVSHTIERLREHGVPGFEVEVIGTDQQVDRRLPAVAEVNMPHYRDLRIGIPSIPELAETLADGAYDAVHMTAPGPAGVAAALFARIARLPLIASHHTELGAYTGLRSGDPVLEAGMRGALAMLYGACEAVLSPSLAADESIASIGVPGARIRRWGRGVDLELYDPAKSDRSAYPGEFKILYAGRLAKEKGIGLLAEAFEVARERDPRLHLLVAGGGPEDGWLRARLGSSATFLGWLDREELARAYASSDLFVFCSQTDTYGQVIAEAQASGLPVIAVNQGGPRTLIRDGHSGWLVDPEPQCVAAAIAQLAASPFLRERLQRAALTQVRGRTWEAAFAQLAACYDEVLGDPPVTLPDGDLVGDRPTRPAPVLRAA